MQLRGMHCGQPLAKRMTPKACMLCISQCFAIMFARNAYSLRTRGFHLEAKDGWREIQRRLCHLCPMHVVPALAFCACIHVNIWFCTRERNMKLRGMHCRHSLGQNDDVRGLHVLCIMHCFIQSCLLITHIRSEQGFFIGA